MVGWNSFRSSVPFQRTGKKGTVPICPGAPRTGTMHAWLFHKWGLAPLMPSEIAVVRTFFKKRHKPL